MNTRRVKCKTKNPHANKKSKPIKSQRIGGPRAVRQRVRRHERESHLNPNARRRRLDGRAHTRPDARAAARSLCMRLRLVHGQRRNVRGQQTREMRPIERDAERAASGVREQAEGVHLGGERDDRAAHAVGAQFADRAHEVAGAVDGRQRAGDEQNLATAVRRDGPERRQQERARRAGE